MSLAEIGVTSGGIAAIALLAWFFFGPKKARQAEVKGNVQEIRITVKGGYSPDVIRVKEGIPLRLVFDRQEASDCSDRVVFPDFQASKSLAPFGTTTLEFTPDKSGSFGFACGMNMLHGTLIVDQDGIDSEGTDEPSEDHGGHEAHVTFAEAVGVGPKLEVGTLAQAEFAIIGGGVTCPTCVVNIESFLWDLPGVDKVDVNFALLRPRHERSLPSPLNLRRGHTPAGLCGGNERRADRINRQTKKDRTGRLCGGSSELSNPPSKAVNRAKRQPPGYPSPLRRKVTT